MASEQRQINVRVRSGVHRTLESLARSEHRSVSQLARLLIEEGLQARIGGRGADEFPAGEIARAASAGGAFDWLAEEPDIYDDSSGEPA